MHTRNQTVFRHHVMAAFAVVLFRRDITFSKSFICVFQLEAANKLLSESLRRTEALDFRMKHQDVGVALQKSCHPGVANVLTSAKWISWCFRLSETTSFGHWLLWFQLPGSTFLVRSGSGLIYDLFFSVAPWAPTDEVLPHLLACDFATGAAERLKLCRPPTYGSCRPYAVVPLQELGQWASRPGKPPVAWSLQSVYLQLWEGGGWQRMEKQWSANANDDSRASESRGG